MMIKNIIFDVGNVLVRWAPYENISRIFPNVDPNIFFKNMQECWIDLNLGKRSMDEAIIIFAKANDVTVQEMSLLIKDVMESQTPIPGSIDLLKKLQALGLNLYSITDNIKELIEYHKQKSEFPKYFKDIIVSADLGILKPNPEIYKHLIDKHHIIPSESVFIDDIIANVDGAISVGMHAFQFIDTNQCEQQLTALGIQLTDVPL